MKLIHLFVLLVASFVAVAYPNPIALTGDTFSHDPSMCKDSTGKYFVFATAVGIGIRTSTDRISWTFEGTVWSTNEDTWTDEYTNTTNANIWAPDCHIVNGEFYLYYTASTGALHSAIFLAKSKTGMPGNWTNEGVVTTTSTADNYNAVDPNLFMDTDGSWYLSLGSWYSGIKQMTLSSSTGKPSSSSITSLAQRFEDNGSIEAAYIYKTGGFYYLFTSWDFCCQGTSSTYNTRVVRSTSVHGPYTDQSGVNATAGGGTLILGTHGSIVGPGGQSIFLDSDGPLLVYHYYTSAGSFLGINHLNFSTGWPVVY